MAAGSSAPSVQRLFDTGAHFAQVKSRRHPSMQPFLIGAKGRQEIINLAETIQQIESAKTVMNTLAKEGKSVLFVGGKVEASRLVRQAAESIGAPYVATRWLGGTISNWNEIKKRIARLAELTATTSGRSSSHTKLELVRLERERQRLSERLDGLTTLEKRPDLLVVVDTKREKHAVKEARDAGIPVIGLMSSDCNVADATYPIVANDASGATVTLILGELAEAYRAGLAR